MLEWNIFHQTPRPQVLLVFGPGDSRSNSLSAIITDHPSYTAVDCRRPSFSGRRCPCLERTSTSRHVCTIHASCHSFLPQTCEVTWRLEVEFAQRHHHWSSVVHGCRLSATELFRSPLPVSGTNFHVTTRLYHPCEFSAVFWRFAIPSSPKHVKWLVIIGHFRCHSYLRKVPRHNLSFGARSFHVSAPRIWTPFHLSVLTAFRRTFRLLLPPPGDPRFDSYQKLALYAKKVSHLQVGLPSLNRIKNRH